MNNSNKVLVSLSVPEIDETFDIIVHSYFADDYMSNPYIHDACAINSYLTENKPIVYNDDGYFDYEYIDLTCGLKMCDNTTETHHTGSGQGFGFSIKYPELYATYQFNSKWFSRDGKVMIENEDFTTNFNGGNSGKNNNTNYPCNCGNYFKDDYMSEPFVVCDCDRDYVKDDYISFLVKSIKENNTDCVITNGIDFNDNGIIDRNNEISKNYIYSNKKCLQALFEAAKFNSVCWGKIFKASKLKNILFDESMKIAEDFKFVYEYLKKCNNIYVSNYRGYYYYLREGSAIRSGFDKKWNSEFDFCEELIKKYERNY